METNSSDASIFQKVVSKHLSDTSDRSRFTVIHRRVQFKLWAAKHFLSKLEQIKREYGALAYPKIKDKVDLNLDAFLYEIIGAFDAQLQEINVAFRCGLDMEDVKMAAVIARMPTGSQARRQLQRLNGNSEGWFWKLREYRNHSAHRSVIGFYSTGTVRPKPMGSTNDPKIRMLEVDKITATYLIDNPRDIHSGKSAQEVIPYCNKSISNMENLIKEIYKKCINELK